MITGRMARRAAALTAVIAAAAAAIMIAPAFAAAASTPGTAAWQVTAEHDLGALAPQTMKVTLVLAPRNASALQDAGFLAARGAHAGSVQRPLRPRGKHRHRGWQLGRRQRAEGQLGLGQPDAGVAHRVLDGGGERLPHRLGSVQHRRQRRLLQADRDGSAAVQPGLAGERGARPVEPRRRSAITHPAHRSSADLNHVLATPGLGPARSTTPPSTGPRGFGRCTTPRRRRPGAASSWRSSPRAT